MKDDRTRDKVRRIAERHMLQLSRLDRIEKELSQLVDERNLDDPGEARLVRRIREILDGKP